MEEPPVNVPVWVWEWNIRITICSCLWSVLQCSMAVSVQGSSQTQCIVLSMLALQGKHFTCENSLFIMLFISVEIPDQKVTLREVWKHMLNIKWTNFLSFRRINILKDVRNLTPHRTYLNNMEKYFYRHVFLDSYLLLNFSGCFSLMIWNLWAIEAS